MLTLKIESPPAASTGDSFTIDVVATGAVNLGAYELAVTYDPAVLWARGTESGPLVGSTGRTTGALGPHIDPDAGTAALGAYSHGAGAGPDGDGVLARVSFLTIGPGGTPLKIVGAIVTDIAGTAVTYTIADGAVATQGERIAPPGKRGRIFLPTVKKEKD